MSVITKIIALLCFGLFLAPGAAQALVLTPSSLDFPLGQSGEGSAEIVVGNDGVEAHEYELKLVSVDLEGGRELLGIEPITDFEENWFTISEERFTLDPAEARIVTIVVNPYDSVETGVYTYALQATEHSAESTGITANTAVLTLLFVTIGEPEAKAELLDFTTSKQVFSELPVNFNITLRNSAERIVQPTGSIQIYNALGTVVRQLPVNVNGKRILPGEERTLMVQWGSGEDPETFFQKLYAQFSQFALGPFTAELTVVPWEGADPLTQQVELTAMPWHTFLVLGLIIFGIVILARFKR
jgi:hypothetical protein